MESIHATEGGRPATLQGHPPSIATSQPPPPFPSHLPIYRSGRTSPQQGTSAAMTKSRTRSTTALTATTIAKELRARLDAEEGDEHAVHRAQVEFWNRLRPILAANDAAVGLEALDTLSLAVLAEDDELPPLLDRAVVILPHPDAALRGEVPVHPLFTFIASSYHGKRSSARGSSKAASPAKKKQRQLRRAPSILRNLPAHVSAKLRADLEQLEQAVAEQGTVVVRLAYRWSGQRAWYDPEAHRDLCLAHYRLVMQFRSVFLDCALYAPTTKANERRKQKLNAVVAWFQFLSRNVELFGYYGFLRLIEKGAHANLMWLGGKTTKHSASAKAAKADHDEDDVPAQEDLATVLHTNPSRYRVIIGRILDSSRVDEDGYASIPEPLEQTHALDPTRPEHLCLSNRALTRVVLDVQGSVPHYPNWVGNTTRGDWKRLLASEDLQATIDEVDEGEPSDDDADDNPRDKVPKDKPHESSDDEDEEADSRTNDKADKDVAATPVSSLGTKMPSPGDDKSSDKGHDKGRDKYLRKTSCNGARIGQCPFQGKGMFSGVNHTGRCGSQELSVTHQDGYCVPGSLRYNIPRRPPPRNMPS
ncbi:unnamed protein product [Phytophthora fragariaefolia]|uniref:Unnamed protein product n=1 Tax=Phytophthora fragariaefolia TaxID=1490495 RepID=A0A9W6XH99_9STRA|nr:unnamed protein product [Phytophthora fragariaefolia]